MENTLYQCTHKLISVFLFLLNPHCFCHFYLTFPFLPSFTILFNISACLFASFCSVSLLPLSQQVCSILAAVWAHCWIWMETNYWIWQWELTAVQSSSGSWQRWKKKILLVVFIIPYVTTHSFVQVSQHSADQYESVLSATLHQRHSEELPQGRTRFSMSYSHRLL